jgi:hypothetical protein
MAAPAQYLRNHFPVQVDPGDAHHDCPDDAGLVHAIFTQGRPSKEGFASILDPPAVDCMTADLLDACRFAAANKAEYTSKMDLDTPFHDVDQSMYEPTRRERCTVPPKRYFTSFWRSTARRLLEMAHV